MEQGVNTVGRVSQVLNTGGKDPRDAFLREGFLQCKAITKKYGTSYFFATQFFPRHIKDAIYAAYAFARIPDEIVDNPAQTDRESAIRELELWRDRWREAMQKHKSDDAVLNAIVYTFDKYGIPSDYGDSFLHSMFQDEEKTTYADYDELEKYMYGSAGVIGLIVTRIVGFSSEKAFPHALKLGYAFQLTNFLRDIREDHDDLGRIYMPQDELDRFGISREDLAAHKCNEKFIAFMKFQIERNREIYREALPGIKMLDLHGRLAVRMSYVLYSEILREIEKLNYDVFRARARTSFGRKLWLAARAVAGIYG